MVRLEESLLCLSYNSFIEPTTGLDPLSRRAIWDMVSLIKKDRVVVLTTHNLEEADFLGDRVMILQTGQVKALGDPLFLKQTYGSGYQVRVTVDSRIADPVAQDILKVRTVVEYLLLLQLTVLFGL